jgi:hypothetical protein
MIVIKAFGVTQEETLHGSCRSRDEQTCER